MKRTIKAVDLFCGAGGTSTGLALACEEAGVKIDLLAINHWEMALRTHEMNHPWARHLCKSLHEINPKIAVPSGRLDLLIASPECTHHSVARGGRPVSDQMRMSAWQIVDWLSALYVSNLIIENVREFRDWGPLDAKSRPIKSRKGETYRAFIGAIKSLGYRIEERIVNAADHGDPTKRERLFIIGRRSTRRICWPEASYDETGMITGRRWRAAREIIDWSIVSQSIFARKRPLMPNTLARIFAGLKMYSGISFVLPPLGYHHRNGKANKPRHLDMPLQTITSRGGGHLVEPFLVNLRGTSSASIRSTAISIEKPAPTLTTSGHLGVIEPFILPHRAFRKGHIDSIDKPLRTFTATNGRITGLVEPFLVPFFGERRGQEPRTHCVNDPLPAAISHGAGGLCEPYLVTVNHGKGEERRAHSLGKPAPTITAKNGLGLVESFLVKYNRTGGAHSVEKPLDTITTKDRFGLVEYPLVEVSGEVYALDVRFRMLKPRELAAAMSFPPGYKFAGNQEQQVKQIGNAVAVQTAKALCLAVLRHPEAAAEPLRETA